MHSLTSSTRSPSRSAHWKNIAKNVDDNVLTNPIRPNPSPLQSLAMGLLTFLGLRRENQWERFTLLDKFLLSPLTFITINVYHFLLFLRGQPFTPPRGRPAIRVVCISDTHEQFVDIPPGDILIHAGDLTQSGTAEEIQKQIDWLKSQPHKVKIVVAGNHDSWFDPRSRLDQDIKSNAVVNLDGLLYLESGLNVQEIKGRKLTIFGAPDVPECGPESFAFQYPPSQPPWFSLIPPQTDILVTHCPPKHHMDLGLGDPQLLKELWRVKPRLHVFGHIHWGHGKESAFFDDMQLAYERLLSRPPRGPFWDFIPNAAWWDHFYVVWHGVHAVLWKWIMGGPGSNQGSLMVNASQAYGGTGKVKNRAIVVDI